MEQTKNKVCSEVLEEGRVLRIILAAGKGNVIDRRAIEDLRAELAGVGTEPRLRAVLLDHEGPHFSFGASVEEHAPGEVETMLPAFHALARELLALDLPILAAVRGMDLELCADRPGIGQVFWMTRDEPWFDEARSFQFAVPAGPAPQRVELRPHPAAAHSDTTVIRLRLDPLDGPGRVWLARLRVLTG